MPMFNFTCGGGIGSGADPVEVDLPDVHGARIEAVQFLADMLKMRPERFWEQQDACVVVADDLGLTLFRLELFAVIAPALQSGRASD